MKKNGKKIALISLLMLAVIICVVVVLLLAKSPDKRLKKQLSLAQKYLVEMDFDQAILAYTRAIEIDPACGEAYIGLAEATFAKHKRDLEVENKDHKIEEILVRDVADVEIYRQEAMQKLEFSNEALGILERGIIASGEEEVEQKKAELLIEKAALTKELAEKSEYWRYGGAHIMREEAYELLDMAAKDYNDSLAILDGVTVDEQSKLYEEKEKVRTAVKEALSDIENRRQIIASMTVTINQPVYHNMYDTSTDNSYYRKNKLEYKKQVKDDGEEHIICSTECGMAGTISKDASVALGDMVVADFLSTEGKMESGGTAGDIGGLGYGLGLKDSAGNIIFDNYTSEINGWIVSLQAGNDGLVYYSVTLRSNNGEGVLPVGERIAPGNYLLYVEFYLNTGEKNINIGIYGETPVTFG